MVSDKIGKIIGKCRLEELVGSGGMGEVYRARHLLLDKIVAVKVLNTNLVGGNSGKEITNRFFREARSAAKLEHENVVHIYDVGNIDQIYYMVMQFVSGESLLEFIKKNLYVDIKTSLKITKSVAKGLHAAHSKNIIHRDIKPANIMISEEGNIKITDFGLAKQIDDDSNVSQIGRVFGTPLYLSPEQAIGERNIDGRADLYSLGITLFHMLTGNPPYGGTSSFVIMQQHVCAPIPSIKQRIKNAPDELEYLLYKLMAKKRKDRFSTAENVIKFIEELEKFVIPNQDYTKKDILDWNISFGKIPQTRRFSKQKRTNFSTKKIGNKKTPNPQYTSLGKTLYKEKCSENPSPDSYRENFQQKAPEASESEKFRVKIGQGGVECIPETHEKIEEEGLKKFRIQMGEDGVQFIPHQEKYRDSEKSEASDFSIQKDESSTKTFNKFKGFENLEEETSRIRIKIGDGGAVEFIPEDIANTQPEKSFFENLEEETSRIRIKIGDGGTVEFIPEDMNQKISQDIDFENIDEDTDKIRIQIGKNGVEFRPEKTQTHQTLDEDTDKVRIQIGKDGVEFIPEKTQTMQESPIKKLESNSDFQTLDEKTDKVRIQIGKDGVEFFSEKTQAYKEAPDIQKQEDSDFPRLNEDKVRIQIGEAGVEFLAEKTKGNEKIPNSNQSISNMKEIDSQTKNKVSDISSKAVHTQEAITYLKSSEKEPQKVKIKQSAGYTSQNMKETPAIVNMENLLERKKKKTKRKTKKVEETSVENLKVKTTKKKISKLEEKNSKEKIQKLEEKASKEKKTHETSKKKKLKKMGETPTKKTIAQNDLVIENDVQIQTQIPKLSEAEELSPKTELQEDSKKLENKTNIASDIIFKRRYSIREKILFGLFILLSLVLFTWLLLQK